MKLRLWALLSAVLALLPATGCLRVASVPIRAVREEKTETFFARLATFTPQQVAAFLDNRMSVILGLSGEQRIAIEAVDLKYARQLRDTVASADSTRDKVGFLRTQGTAKEAELKSLLTPDQFSRYLAKEEDMRAALRSWVEGN